MRLSVVGRAAWEIVKRFPASISWIILAILQQSLQEFTGEVLAKLLGQEFQLQYSITSRWLVFFVLLSVLLNCWQWDRIRQLKLQIKPIAYKPYTMSLLDALEFVRNNRRDAAMKTDVEILMMLRPLLRHNVLSARGKLGDETRVNKNSIWEDIPCDIFAKQIFHGCQGGGWRVPTGRKDEFYYDIRLDKEDMAGIRNRKDLWAEG